MSAIIFDQDHLSTSLLAGSGGPPPNGSSVLEHPTGLEASSTSSLDSSRRSMNLGLSGQDPDVRERLFSGRGVVVELSKTDSRTSSHSRTLQKSLSHFGDSADSADGTDDDEEEEEGDDHLSFNGHQKLIVNEATESYADSTLPRPYNPGMSTTSYPQILKPLQVLVIASPLNTDLQCNIRNWIWNVSNNN